MRHDLAESVKQLAECRGTGALELMQDICQSEAKIGAGVMTAVITVIMVDLIVSCNKP